MENNTFEKVAGLWLAEKKHFVKKSTYAAYSLTVVKHLVPEFGWMTAYSGAMSAR